MVTKKFFSLRTLLLIVRDVFVIFILLGASLFAFAYFNAPGAASLANAYIAQTSIIYDRTGQHVLYEIHGEENRKVLTHAQIPDSMRIATIAAEDDSFYSHPGIDVLSTLRALFVDIRDGEVKQGGSTITQQLARNMFLTKEKTFRRKILEMILAAKLERMYSKAEILDMYLNQVPYGANAYGIEAASQTYFGKSASALTLDEASFLAAIPKATAYYSPYGDHASELVARQKKILTRLDQLRLASADSVTEAKNTNTLEKIIRPSNAIFAPHFVFYVKDALEKKYGSDAIEKGGLKIYTTLDYDLQKLAEQSISDNSKLLTRYGASNSALVALDPKTGQILAMVGSRDYYDDAIDGQVNVAISPRQPGSSFKPFAYATAFEKGYQPENLLLDAPTNFGNNGSGRDYIPRNYDGKFHGVVSMRQALAQSLNVPAIKTLYLAGIDATIDMAHRLGITTLNDRNRYGLSLVLGGGEVKLLDETAGYSVFADDGIRNPTTPILKIADSTGNILENYAPGSTQVIDSQVARKINSILSDNASRVPIFGAHNKLFIPGRTVAAKTGTTQEYKDAWTVGYTPDIAVGVWAGNNNNRSMRAGADGSYVAAPIWNQFMSEALKRYTDESFIAYDKVEVPKTSAPEVKITYYKISSGKKISAEKAKKMDPDKVSIKIESLPGKSSQNKSTPGLPDSMLAGWNTSSQDNSLKKYFLTK